MKRKDRTPWSYPLNKDEREAISKLSLKIGKTSMAVDEVCNILKCTDRQLVVIIQSQMFPHFIMTDQGEILRRDMHPHRTQAIASLSHEKEARVREDAAKRGKKARACERCGKSVTVGRHGVSTRKPGEHTKAECDEYLVRNIQES